MLINFDSKTCNDSAVLGRVAKGVQTIFGRLNSGNTKRVFIMQIVRRISFYQSLVNITRDQAVKRLIYKS